MVGLNLTKPYICTANYFEMKKFLIHLVIPFSVLLTSCGGDDKGSETSNDNAGETTQPATDFSGMQKVSLNDFQLEAEGMVPQIAGPNGDIIPYTVLHEEDDFFWVIEIGPEGEKFRLIIENAAGMEGDLVAEKKKMFEDFWEIEYLVDEKNIIMYRKAVKGEESVPNQFHVFGVMNVDDIPYKIYSDETIQFRKPEAEEMLRSVRSLIEGSTKTDA